jgi:hypothetical protein
MGLSLAAGNAATLLDETIQPITAIAPAFLTTHAQHIELADQIREDDCAVAGHHTSPDGLILGCTVLFK